MNDTWVNSGSVRNAAVPQTIYLHDHLDFIFLDSELRLEEASNLQPVHIALVFGDHPLTNTSYTIRNNAMTAPIPPTGQLYQPGSACRDRGDRNSSESLFFPLEFGYPCPINNYYYSDFLAIQSIVEATWLKVS